MTHAKQNDKKDSTRTRRPNDKNMTKKDNMLS